MTIASQLSLIWGSDDQAVNLRMQYFYCHRLSRNFVGKWN